MLLVDASNAFNSLSRHAALLNIQNICPALSKVLINTYRQDIQLFIDGDVLFSQEGTIQGDPLTMVMYAVAITPLIQRLEDEKSSKSGMVWYTDDATAGGNLSNIKAWWNSLSEIGPDYGYYPNALKTWLIVKEEHLENAKKVFQGTGISITAEGRRHLGAAIGTQSFVESYVQRKLSGWVEEVERLSMIANSQPHAAYTAFGHGMKNSGHTWRELSWTYKISCNPWKMLLGTASYPHSQVRVHSVMPIVI